MLTKKLLTSASLIGMSFVPLAQAADQFLDNRWYVAPFASYIETGGDRKAADGWGGGLGVGKIINEHFNAELRGFYQGFGGTNGPWDLAGGTADLQYYFFRDKFSPYAVMGLGAMNSCASANCGIGLIGEAGLGVSYEVADNLLIRSDVRYRYNNNLNAQVQPGTDEFHDMTVNLGVVIPFGEKPKYVAKAEPYIAPPPVDDCSTRDEDADGVNDCLDKCPGTIKGATVDHNGCAVRLILKGQHFKYDSAELTVKAQGILDDVAKSLIAYPQKNEIEIQGHASSEGSDSYNMKLSQRRAYSVLEYLKMKGVTNKLNAKGYGETQPIADNKTEAGRSENRRVELIWIEE
ncbi:MAG: OmpA family protein [Methylomonas sp.]|jgi:OOP family OmpA-OmpF porin|uniref:OmpA family protein n=1 Tax=Methylomonas sp. TaxID=418 RepID=UPI0025E6A09E|nr:OmpA family protein [Methylomonas sp.]MCK9605358.1 OmpA family protein [Methylomonas sp.]